MRQPSTIVSGGCFFPLLTALRTPVRISSSTSGSSCCLPLLFTSSLLLSLNVYCLKNCSIALHPKQFMPTLQVARFHSTSQILTLFQTSISTTDTIDWHSHVSSLSCNHEFTTTMRTSSAVLTISLMWRGSRKLGRLGCFEPYSPAGFSQDYCG